MGAREVERLFEPKGMKIPFGIHAGKRWSEVPRNYKLYMATQGMQKRHPELYAELLHDIVKTVESELRDADAVAHSAAMARFDLEAEGLC